MELRHPKTGQRTLCSLPAQAEELKRQGWREVHHFTHGNKLKKPTRKPKR